MVARAAQIRSLAAAGGWFMWIFLGALFVSQFLHTLEIAFGAQQSLRRLCCFALGRKINYFCSPPRCIVNKKPAKIKYWTGPWGKEEHSALKERESQADSLLNSRLFRTPPTCMLCKAAAECACVCDRLVISGGNGAGWLLGWLLDCWPDPLRGFVLYLPACQPEWCSKVSPRRLNHSQNTLGARPNIINYFRRMQI